MLDLKLEIYIPLKYKEILEFEYKNRFYFIETLAKTFGGLTIRKDNKGLWLNNKTKVLDTDNITILEIYVEKGFWRYNEKAKDLFFEIIATLKQMLNQECIAYTINNNMDFY